MQSMRNIKTKLAAERNEALNDKEKLTAFCDRILELSETKIELSDQHSRELYHWTRSNLVDTEGVFRDEIEGL